MRIGYAHTTHRPSSISPALYVTSPHRPLFIHFAHFIKNLFFLTPIASPFHQQPSLTLVLFNHTECDRMDDVGHVTQKEFIQ